MRLVWLESFVAVAETQSYSLAARRLKSKQPTVTRRVQALQKWLRRPLVIAGSRPVEITPDGEAFMTVAKEVLDRLHSSRAEFPTEPSKEERKISAKDIVIAPPGSAGES